MHGKPEITAFHVTAYYKALPISGSDPCAPPLIFQASHDKAGILPAPPQPSPLAALLSGNFLATPDMTKPRKRGFSLQKINDC
jgi:hypothetical protein